MPEFMIKKVAIGQGFRLAFPNELGDMPYLVEELEGLEPHGPPAPPPQTNQSTDIANPFVGRIEKVDSKSGKNTKGKEWINYRVVVSGVLFSTFNAEVGEGCKTLQGSEVTVTWGQKDQYRMIEEIEANAGI
jgi:hypothetical protein